MQNVCLIAKILRRTMRGAKSDLRSESDWSKNKQTCLHFLDSVGELKIEVIEIGTWLKERDFLLFPLASF